MQLELISWRGKAEVFCHQLAFDFFSFLFLVGVLANPVRGTSCPAHMMLWVGAGRTGRDCGPIQSYSKGWTVSDACKLKMELPLTS